MSEGDDMESTEQLVVPVAKALGFGGVDTEPYWLGSEDAARRALAAIEAEGYAIVKAWTGGR